MRAVVLVLLSVVCLASSDEVRALEPEKELARQLVARADSLLRGQSNHSVIRMTIVRPDWSRSMTLESWERGGDLSFIVVREPPREAGTAFLKREGQMWSWLPDVERTIKIPPSMMMESWMGSDYTHDDLMHESSLVEDYEHSIAGRDTVDGKPCYILRLEPKRDAPVVWDRIDYWVDLDEVMPLREEFYDERGRLVRVMTLDDIRTLDDRRLPTRWTLVPQLESGNRTLIELLEIEFDVDIPDRIFTRQHLERAR